VKTVADRYTHGLIITNTGNRLFRFINNDDLERPRIFPKGVFSVFFAIFGCNDALKLPNLKSKNEFLVILFAILGCANHAEFI